MILYRDEKFNFYELFNEQNGLLIRSDVEGTKEDPNQRSFPELIDIGIMGHCISGHQGICRRSGVDCYQMGDIQKVPHMKVDDYETIAHQAAGKTFQIALGGAGDPNKHPEFEKILQISRYYNIVPNLTTSGYGLTDTEIGIIKKYCGAVAVSWYSRLVIKDDTYDESNFATIECINRLVNYGCQTNVHYVVSKDTIDEAILRLQDDLFPIGIAAVIFILYKPVGYGKKDKVLSDDEKLDKFLMLAIEHKHPYRIGFDTCFTAALVRKNISPVCIDACEAGTFSMYINSQLKCYPCSFGQNNDLYDSMKNKSLRDVWNGEVFSSFRAKSMHAYCNSCSSIKMCQGGCKIGLDINLCNNK